MREAMYSAKVGDDVYGEDPTVNELEAMAAERLGKEAALFVASGTMGNLVAILSHAARGDEVIVGYDAHSYRSEAGGMSTLGGIVPKPLPTNIDGTIDLDVLETSINPDDPHCAPTRLICLENTYGARNGWPVSPGYMSRVRELSDRFDLKVHLDGARFFNAAVALDIDPKELARPVDSVSFCLSKGLCAPVGSILCGSSGFIHKARRVRKVLGGGMRQAGILAAAGVIALNEMVDRLVEDHANARLLAYGLAEMPGITIDPARIRTNIVLFDLAENSPFTVDEVSDRLRDEHGILLGSSGRCSFRAVTHFWVGSREVEQLLDALGRILAEYTG